MINWRDGIRAMKCGLLAVFLLITVSSTTQAGPLPVVLDPLPSLMVSMVTSVYNATTGAFNASGSASTLDRGPGLGGKKNISGSFSLSATISNAGVVSNAQVRVGTIGAPMLFSNTLANPSFAFSGNSLEFLFTNVSGSYVNTGIYDGATTPLDVTFTGLGAAFPGNFLTGFTSTFNTVEIREEPSIPNPEPGTLLLVLAGAGGLYRQARRRKQG